MTSSGKITIHTALYKKIALITIIIFSSLYVNSQTLENNSDADLVDLHKNVFYGTVGFLPVSWGVLNTNYERLVKLKKESLLKYYYLRLAIGNFSSWGAEGSHYVIGATALSGKSKHHFEVFGGLTILYDQVGYEIGVSNAKYFSDPVPSRWEFILPVPAAAIGYRLQEPGGRFVFRSGFGFPETIYISLGFSF